MKTKAQIIDQAYIELGIASPDFDLQPQERLNALNIMDGMVAGWQADGAFLPYVFGGTESGQSGLPLWAFEAVYLGLAVAISSGLGKALGPVTMMRAADAKRRCVNKTAMPPPVRARNTMLPSGAGNVGWNDYLVDTPAPITAGKEELEF